MRTFEVDAGAGQLKGAIWMGGAAPLVDSDGNVWVASGNGSVTSGTVYDNSDSVLKLSPTLQLLRFFAPSDWQSDNAGDHDLGSAAPALLDHGLVLQAGKSQTAYLLTRPLGGIGSQKAQLSPFCGGDVDGGNAFVGTVVYSPCRSGVEAVRVSASPPSVSEIWQTPSGSGGPPIVASNSVWTISQAGELFALDPSTGTVQQQFSIGSVANHFPTPSVGDHLLLAPATDRVFAFAGPGGVPVSPVPPPRA